MTERIIDTETNQEGTITGVYQMIEIAEVKWDDGSESPIYFKHIGGEKRYQLINNEDNRSRATHDRQSDKG